MSLKNYQLFLCADKAFQFVVGCFDERKVILDDQNLSLLKHSYATM